MSLPTQTYQRGPVMQRDSEALVKQAFSAGGLLLSAAALGVGGFLGYYLTKEWNKPSSRITKGPKTNVDLEVIHIYEDENGESHFGVFTIPLAEQGPIGALSRIISTSDEGVRFRYTSGTYHYPLHVAPRRQFIVHLDGGVRITTSDGRQRDILPGQVQFVSDTKGKGHKSESINGEDRYSVFIAVSDDWIIPRTRQLYEGTKGEVFD